MKQGQICQQPQLLRQVPGNVAVVEVDAGDDGERSVPRERGAEHPLVAADIGSDPVSGEVERIRNDSRLPCLQGNVGVAKVGVGEH